MRKIKILGLMMMVLVTTIAFAQTPHTGKVVEYSLPSEDNKTGTFYLGRFVVGKYEISGNVTGVHANNTGWKIFIGTNWGGGNLKFTQVYNNVTGEGNFIYQKDGNAYFHLWWDPNYGSGGQMWIPHIKVEYQAGGCNYNNPEPTRSNIKVLEDNSNVSINSLKVKNNVGIGTTNPQAKLHIENGTLDIGNKNDENALRFRRNNDGAPVGEIGLNASNEFRLRHVGGGGHFTFFTNNSNTVTEKFRIANNGNVGIGTTNPKEKLSVNGTILAKEVKVSTDASDWPDFVFSDTYQLKDLSEVESFIKTNKHLPDIPSAVQMEEQGVNLAEMNKLLLQKVEELTLYAIEQKAEAESQKGEREKLEEKVVSMERELEKIKELITNNIK